MESGDEITVEYTVTLHCPLIDALKGYLKDGTIFDSTESKGKQFTFAIGKGKVIRGWDESLVGVCVG